MRPGAWDTAGFLLPSESLATRLATDLELCSLRGFDPERIGIRLRALLTAAASSDVGRPRRLGDHSVTLIRQRGMITCPWADDEFERCPVSPPGDPTANRFRIDSHPNVLEGFELSAHLIGAHGFFGGAGTRFRIEPEVAAAVIGAS